MSGSQAVYTACIAVVGLINLLPMLGVISANRIASAYGVSVDGPDLEILLRHRALLFGIVGGFVLASLGLPQYRLAALVLAAISMVGFVALALTVGGYGSALGRVLAADIVGIAALVGALALHFLAPE